MAIIEYRDADADVECYVGHDDKIVIVIPSRIEITAEQAVAFAKGLLACAQTAKEKSHIAKDYFVRFLLSETEITGLTLDEARAKAKAYVGNNMETRMFPNEDSFIYGPGDGSTSCMVRKELKL